MGRKTWRNLAVGAGALLALACSEHFEDSAGAVFRDSAGVTIVDNGAPPSAELNGWTLSESPSVRIGRTEGEAQDQLYRATSAVRRSDGIIVVANGGSNQLRHYTSDGEFLFSAGRSGEGPGEFRNLLRVWLLPGDSVAAYDPRLTRIAIFSPAGEYVRTIALEVREGRQVMAQGVLSDRSVIAIGGPLWGASGATTGIVRDSVPYYRFNPAGDLVDTLGTFPFREAFRLVSGDDWRLAAAPFARTPVIEVVDSGFHFGPAESYEIQSYSASGALLRVIRLAEPERPVTKSDLEWFRSDVLERADRGGSRQFVERMLSLMPFPETLPPYGALKADTEGNLWVGDYSTHTDVPRKWTIFSRTGEFLGTMTLPGQLQVFQIGGDFLLGRWTDSLGVEQVQLYELDRRQ